MEVFINRRQRECSFGRFIKGPKDCFIPFYHLDTTVDSDSDRHTPSSLRRGVGLERVVGVDGGAADQGDAEAVEDSWEPG